MSAPGAAVPPRCDLAVVMARGQGRRMGAVKGLLRPRGWDCSFAGRLVRTYAAAGLPALVMVAAGQQEAFAGDLQGTGLDPGCVVAGPQGGDTALTLLAAWRLAGRRSTHVWAQPVDMPLVSVETLRGLLAASRAEPGRVVRPAVAGRPGHPVVLPAWVLRKLEAAPGHHDGPMQAFLAQLQTQDEAAGTGLLPCADDGAVRDFDEPADLPE